MRLEKLGLRLVVAAESAARNAAADVAREVGCPNCRSFTLRLCAWGTSGGRCCSLQASRAETATAEGGAKTPVSFAGDERKFSRSSASARHWKLRPWSLERRRGSDRKSFAVQDTPQILAASCCSRDLLSLKSA